MDVENRHIKAEASSNDPTVGGGGGDVTTREDNGEPEPTEDETGRPRGEQQHHRTKTFYSLNMNVCRLCLSEGHGHLQPVFYAHDSPDEYLQQKILELTTVQITYANDFPTAICIECLTKLDEYSIFRRQCIESNEILKLKYYELKTGEVSERLCKQEQKDPDDDNSAVVEVKQENDSIELDDGGAGNEIIIGEGPDVFVGQQEQQVTGTKIQYMADDGTMAEYITSGAIVRRGAASPDLDDDVAEGHEVYYTVGTDTYTIPSGVDPGGFDHPSSNYVPQGFENQTEIECTTIDDHLPEEYVGEGPVPAVVQPSVTNTAPPITLARGRHDRPFVCKHCKTSFKYEHNFDRHMKNHAKVLYRCGKCSKTFVKQRKCQQHFLKAHSSKRYECDICYRTYSLPTRLENHVIEMHSMNGVYRCDRCQGELFSTYLDFKAHRMHFHPRNNDLAATGAVGMAEPTPTIIKQTRHGDIVHMEHVLSTLNAHSPPASPSSESEDEQPIITRRPRAITSSTASTTRSGRTRPYAPKSYPGRVAKGSASGVDTLSQPNAQHEIILIDDDEQHQHKSNVDASGTNGTGRTPIVHRELLQQIEESEANSPGPRTYPCDNCPKTFIHLNNLKAHIYAEHDNDKPFKCRVCPISFKTKEILVMHMLLHSQNNSDT